MMEILTAIVIGSILLTIGLYNFTDMIKGSTEGAAEQLQANLQKTYASKTSAGLQHGTSASAQLTKDLLDAMTQSDSSLQGRQTANVNERIIRTSSGKSMAAMVPTLELPKTYAVAGSTVHYADGLYQIDFAPTAVNKGTWTVTVIGAQKD